MSNDRQQEQSMLSVPVIASSLIGVFVFWFIKQILEKKNFENTARILSDNFQRTQDLQAKELKEEIKSLQAQIDAKIDIIEQKNVHINLINKEFHNLQKNYNRLKKESIFLKDQLHNAQLDIVEFEQENVNLVNQLNDALQHINSLDQLIENEKLTDQSISKIDEEEFIHAETTQENFSELMAAAESTKNIITSSTEKLTTKQVTAKLSRSNISIDNLYKRKFVPRDDFYDGDDDDNISVTESHEKSSSKHNSVASARESTKQSDFPESNNNIDLDQPVEKKRVSNIEFEEDEIVNEENTETAKNTNDDHDGAELRSFPSNIIYDENIITNANPPSPMKYDYSAQRRGHAKTESSFSHRSYKSGKSSKSSKSNTSKVIINPDNGSEIMVTGPTNLRRNRSAGKSFGIFHFGKTNNHNTANEAQREPESMITNAHMYDVEDDYKFKWVSELENLKNSVSRSNSTKRKSVGSSGYGYHHNHHQFEDEIDVPEKETKTDVASDVLMVDYQRGVIYSKDYNASSNLIPKLSKGNKFGFKRKSGDKAAFERRAVSSST
ncbi:hypothetical protein DASC09_063480 [Saccharomycopsis crataegensis]|uniref:Uncharacterized protein n=1 Tax=Saccharomycopsis crataegensis TaxID=43959 RepID=A0AAV5QWD3_9ASCO|nr:hypothetical protein DASC09_063480 [Saccharomycopsis crataegensis]